jgi:hypothetical protein
VGDVRLMLALALAGGACGAAEAQPEQTSGIRTPAGWQELPAVATAARMALAETGARIAGCEAWGEPAMGCYAVWLATGGAGTPDELARQILVGLAAEQIETAEVVQDGDRLEAAITRPGSAEPRRTAYRGRLHARLGGGGGGVAALTCVDNGRESEGCRAACTTLFATWSKP